MNKIQLLLRQREQDAAKEAEAASPANMYLNCAPGFWDAYRARVGSLRRRALVAIFQRFPLAKLPVNNRYQAKSADPDLALLMKRGVLLQVRPGAAYKTSRKRQSYLVLASRPAGEA